MSFLSGGFFGGGTKETKQTTTTTNVSQDQRVQVGGSAGSVVSPGAAVGGGGAVVAAPYSSVTQSITSTGMTPAQVTGLLDNVFGYTRDLAGQITGSLSGPLAGVTEALSATRAPEQTALTSMMPLLIILGVLYFLSR